MPVAQSVFGYFTDAIVKDLQQGSGLRSETVELPVEPGKSKSQIRVRRSDIEEVRLGPTSKGHTSVQIILKPEASYEFVSLAPREEDLLTTIQDPVFGHFPPWRPGPIVIYAGPTWRQQLNGTFQVVQANKT